MKINYPAHGWLVAFRDFDEELTTLDGQPLLLPDDNQECYSISPDWQAGGLIMPLWFPVDMLRRHPNVEYVRRTWYVMEENEVPAGAELPEGECVDQCVRLPVHDVVRSRRVSGCVGQG